MLVRNALTAAADLSVVQRLLLSDRAINAPVSPRRGTRVGPIRA